MPRFGFGADRGCNPYLSAAGLSAAIDRARLKPPSSPVPAISIRMRNSSGSAFAANAISSMNDSAAKVDCGPFGSRRLPVRNGVSQTSGSPTTSSSVRRLGISYMSFGNAELPAAGLSRRCPNSCAISTVSGSLYPRWL